MASIRPKQIKINLTNTPGSLIVSDALDGKGLELPLGATNQVLTVDSTATFPEWQYNTALRDSSGDLALLAVAGGDNYLEVSGAGIGDSPSITAVGADTDIDIELTPKGTGEILAPVGYTVTSDNALITKSYADAIVSGLDFKNSIRVSTSSSTELAGYTYNAGNEPTGLVWTGVTSPVFDGVTVLDGDRVLIKNASDPRGNGLFVYDEAQSAFIRTDDANSDTGFGQVSGGLFVFVEEGNTKADTGWVLSSPDGSATLGTDNLSFTQFSAAGVVSVAAGDGISVNQVGTVFTVSADADEVTITNQGTTGSGDSLSVRSTSTEGQVLRSTGTAGQAATWGALDLANASAITGTLGVTNGGTGLSTIPQGSILVANSPDTLTALDGGAGSPTVNQILLYNFVSDQLEWTDATSLTAFAYGVINADSGSITANSNTDDYALVGTGGITTIASTGPDVLTIDLDFSTLSVLSNSTATDQIIINQGGTNYVITVSELISDVVLDNVDRYNSISDGVNTETADLAGSTILFTGTGGIVTEIGSPHTVTVDLDLSTLPTASSVDVTDQIIINQGGNNYTTTIQELVDAAAPSYSTINGDSGTANAASAGDTLNVVGGSNTGILVTASDGTPDELKIEIDFSTLSLVSSVNSTDEIILNVGGNLFKTTVTELLADAGPAYGVINGDTGSVTATTPTEALDVNGAGGIAVTAATGTPDSLTIDLDFSSLSTVSTTTALDELIINQGGTNVVITLDDLISTFVVDTVDRYNAISDGVNTETADLAGSTITFNGTLGVGATVSSPNTVDIELDFASLPLSSVVAGSDEIIINTNTGPAKTTVDEFLESVGVGIVLQQDFTATSNQTVYTLTSAPISDVTVFFNGLALAQSSFTVSGTTLTLIPANIGYGVDAGDVISARYEA